MKFFLVALLASSIAGVLSASQSVDTFESFKLKFSKVYDSPLEEANARLNFHRSQQWIAENSHKYDHDLGITSLADLDDDTDFFQALPLAVTQSHPVHHPANTTHSTTSGSEHVPDSYDWREHIHMHEPEAQGRCGSCWAFVSATCMEARLAITEKITVHLSRQELLDCTRKVVKTNNGCHGGHAYDGWEYSIKDGVHDDTVYPYHQQQGVCHSDLKGKKYHMKSVHKLPHRASDKDLMLATMKYGPLNVNIFANHNEFKFYKGGLMKNVYPNATNHNHAVVLVGWGFDHKANLPYWIVRNSWGPHSWGEGGYARVQRGINSMGMNDYVSCVI